MIFAKPDPGARVVEERHPPLEIWDKRPPGGFIAINSGTR